MKIAINIDPEYRGPSILDMAALLPLDKAEFAWKDTRSEIEMFREQPDGEYTLFVPTASAAVAAANRLGVSCPLPADLIKKGILALKNPNGKWREFVDKNGFAVARSILLKAHAQNAKRGHVFPPLQKILSEVVLHNRSIADAEALLGLREKGGIQ